MALVGHETDVVAVLRFELGLEFDDPAEIGRLFRRTIGRATNWLMCGDGRWRCRRWVGL